MQVYVRFFAATREALGTEALHINTTAPTVGALRDELLARGGAWAQALGRGRALRVALDHRMADDETALHEGAEVAFFPPVTGG
ncbi:MAG: molybdopterin converting factor subunit 1 [Tepidimonas sp.]|uniref:molybdopterin converting factor subunit 1 n=1 Tax=Tepidimonas sp. TaxID=2002775 RepID=UPI004054CFE1